MDRWNRYSTAWVLWLAAFAAIETRALAGHRPNDTLSQNVRWWFATDARGRGPARLGKLRRVALLTFLSWFTVHITTDGMV